MKIAKKLLPTILLLSFAFFAIAQQTNNRQFDPEKMAEKQTERMVKQLSLNEKQAEQVEVIHLKYAKQQQQRREGLRAEKEARRTERQKVRDAKMAELKKVLTPEQYTKLEKANAEHAERRIAKKNVRRRYGNLEPEKRSGVMTDKMVDALGLNAEQAKAIRQINLDFAKKREALLSKNKEAQQPNKEAMRKLKDEQKSAFAEVLTPEQMEKLKANAP